MQSINSIEPETSRLTEGYPYHPLTRFAFSLATIEKCFALKKRFHISHSHLFCLTTLNFRAAVLLLGHKSRLHIVRLIDYLNRLSI